MCTPRVPPAVSQVLATVLASVAKVLPGLGDVAPRDHHLLYWGESQVRERTRGGKGSKKYIYTTSPPSFCLLRGVVC